MSEVVTITQEMTPELLDAIAWGAPDPRHKNISLDTLLRRIAAVAETVSSIPVTPENCMRAPTVQAIVQAVSRRIATSPVRVMKKSFNSKGREMKELLPNHPVARLLSRPNSWQNRYTYWLDATSTLIRWGRYYAWKGQASTGPIRSLQPLDPGAVTIKRDLVGDLLFEATMEDGSHQTFEAREVHHVRGPARDFLKGDSPVSDVREAIGLEIAAERFGAAFFGNGAMPLVFFKFLEGHKFGTKEEEAAFLKSFEDAFGGRKRFKGMVVPPGMEMDTAKVENDKAQFIETRKFVRTVIAGAFGVPPHLVGDLERATFNNVEQQDKDFTINVVLPYVQMFEAAMEADLLTDRDRRDGVILRFNLDAIQRADFKSRQEGLQIQRRNGVINSNEWREAENRNPIDEEDGGEDYITESNMSTSGEEPKPDPVEEDDPEEQDDD